MSFKGLVTLIVVAVLIYAGVMGYGYANSLRNESVDKETHLNAQYLDAQNYLSSYVSGFHEKVSVAGAKADRIDQILADAVKGRYEGDNSGMGKGGAFFSAIVEAYPDAGKDLALYDKIVDYVQSGREGYRQVQSGLLDNLRAYDKWREEGIVQSWIIAHVIGVPSKRLEARVGTTTYTGNEARNKMYLIVLDSKTIKAYDTGVMDPLQVPSSTEKK